MFARLGVSHQWQFVSGFWHRAGPVENTVGARVLFSGALECGWHCSGSRLWAYNSLWLRKTPQSLPIRHVLEYSEASPFLVPGFPSDGNQNACGKGGADLDLFRSDSGRHPKPASRQEDEGVQSTQGLQVLFDFQNQERRMNVWCRGKILAVEISLLWAKCSPHLSCYLTFKGSIYLCLLHSINLVNLTLGKEEYNLVYELGKVASISARLLSVLWTRSLHLCSSCLCRNLCLPSQAALQFCVWGINKTVFHTNWGLGRWKRRTENTSALPVL